MGLILSTHCCTFFCLCSMSQNGTMLVPHGQRLQLLVGYSL